MARYITVLKSTTSLKYWRAVQVADSLEEIRKNKYYTAGVNTSVPKTPGDTFVEDKTITEVSTHATANASVYKIAQSGSNAVRLMSGTAPKSFIKTFGL